MRGPPTRTPRAGGVGAAALAVLLLLLAAPALAFSRLAPGIDWRILAGMPLAASLVTWLSYRSDKRRAEAGQRRIPETTLHFWELLGGWPGAFLAQRQFRHKSAKGSYQAGFWLIVLVHEFVASDFLMNWKMTKAVARIWKS